MNAIISPQQIPLLTTKTRLLHSWSRSVVLRMLIGLKYGRLIVREGSHTMVFGLDDRLTTTVQVHDPSFYVRVLTAGSIGAGEAYVDGLWDADDLTSVVRILVVNQDVLNQLEQKVSWLLTPINRLRHSFNGNSRSGSKKNILAHYDLGNDMYRSFLDPTMMYSAAVYPDANSSLEQASQYKLDLVCRKINLQPEDRVIEIGTGWGGFAIHAALNYGCHVTTTTISDAQYEEAQKRVDDLKLGDRITLLKKDYRDLKGSFDKLVSIEMIEAVGHRHLPGFIDTCSRLLKADGVMFIQAITIKEQLYRSYLNGVDFIQRHIFPGGCLLSNQRLVSLIGENSDMVVRTIDDFGFDYARTLRDWRSRFSDAFRSLQKRGYDERFRRLWDFYFCYCEGGFLERSVSVVQLTATKPHNRDHMALP